MKFNKPKPFICGKIKTFEELNVGDYLYCYANPLQCEDFRIGDKYRIIEISLNFEDEIENVIKIRLDNYDEMGIYYKCRFWGTDFFADDFFIPVKKT